MSNNPFKHLELEDYEPSTTLKKRILGHIKICKTINDLTELHSTGMITSFIGLLDNKNKKRSET